MYIENKCFDCKFCILTGRQHRIAQFNYNGCAVDVLTTNWDIIGECDRQNRGYCCKRKLAKPEKIQKNKDFIKAIINLEV